MKRFTYFHFLTIGSRQRWRHLVVLLETNAVRQTGSSCCFEDKDLAIKGKLMLILMKNYLAIPSPLS